MKRNRMKQLVLTIGLLAIVALALSSCGGSDGKSGNGETARSSDVTKYEDALTALYKGDFEPPTGEPVEAPRGKKIWAIMVGMNVEGSQNAVKGFKEASELLGWDMTYFDGKFESSRWLTGIQQALADKAEGIILFTIDCAPVKAGLEQAKQAGVPVVSVESRDCNPGLSSYNLTYARDQNFQEWIENGFAGDQARWVLARTKGEAKTIVTVETDLFVTRVALPGIERAFDECPTCEIVDVVEFVGTELGPPLQAKIEQSLNEHPEANSFIAAYDGVMTISGGAAALRSSGRAEDMAIMGGEGSAPMVELMYNEAGVDACSGIDYRPEAYGAVMGLIRIFAGKDPYEGHTGIGSQVCDLDHNLPPKGEAYQAPIDYLSEYKKLWELK